MDGVFGPLEGRGVGVVDLDEVVDGITDLAEMSEAGALECGARQDAEPEFDLVEPAGPGGDEVEMHVLVLLEPAVVLGLVSIEVVEDHVEVDVWGVVGDEFVHEGEEVAPRAPRMMARLDATGGHLEGSEKGGGAVPFVLMAVAGEGATVG